MFDRTSVTQVILALGVSMLLSFARLVRQQPLRLLTDGPQGLYYGLPDSGLKLSIALALELRL